LVYNHLNLNAHGENCYQQALEIIKTFGDRPSEEAIWNYLGQNAQKDVEFPALS
ncbi:MAG: hypothetical protein ICV63_17035, partial [Coleofasciculus sp. Co-bin14]|nr:hypothetical protein [Coleofasciculus sp. Co-bin14]